MKVASTLNDVKVAIAEYEKHKGAPLAQLFAEEEKKRLKELAKEDAAGTVATASKPTGSLDDAIAAMKKWGAALNGLDMEKVWLDDLVDDQIVEQAIEEAQAESGVKDYDQWGGF